MKLIVERSEATGDWWVRCVARNGRIVGTSQEGYRNKAHAVEMAWRLSTPRAPSPTGWGYMEATAVQKLTAYGIKIAPAEGGWRWSLGSRNGNKVFGSHEVLTKRAHAERMAYRVLNEAHELEVRG